MAHMTKTQATTEWYAIEADRTALFRREAAGEVVTEAEWFAVADRQAAVDRVLLPSNAQGFYVGPDWV